MISATGLRVPGVHLQDVLPPVAPTLLTGVPVFLGYTGTGAAGEPVPLLVWQAFLDAFGAGPPGGNLAPAVYGFFAAGGPICHVVGLDPALSPLEALSRGLAAVRDLDAADLVCAPDVTGPTVLDGAADPAAAAAALQAVILADCRRTGGRFAILDAVPTADPELVLDQRAALRRQVLGRQEVLGGNDGALYHPWPWAAGADGVPRHVPPCGHVAAVYARTDAAFGVHRAPANEALDTVLDLRADLSDDEVGRLTAAGVNCLRALPGRGIRVWGARTLSDDPAWRQVGGRRVLLTVGRWLHRFLAAVVHEPADVRLRVRVMREVGAYLDGLYAAGALRGRTPDEAFYVRCDSETTPPELAEAGVLVTTIGLALSAPAEFLVLRVTHGASGVTAGPSTSSA